MMGGGSIRFAVAVLVVALVLTLEVVAPYNSATQSSRRTSPPAAYSEGCGAQESIEKWFHSTVDNFFYSRLPFERSVLNRATTSLDYVALHDMRESFDKIVQDVFQYDLITFFIMALHSEIEYSCVNSFETMPKRLADKYCDGVFDGSEPHPIVAFLATTESASDNLSKPFVRTTLKSLIEISFKERMCQDLKILEFYSTSPNSTSDVIAATLGTIVKGHSAIMSHMKRHTLGRDQKPHKMFERLNKIYCYNDVNAPSVAVRMLIGTDMHSTLITHAYELAIVYFLDDKDVDLPLLPMVARTAVDVTDVAAAKKYINIMMKDVKEKCKSKGVRSSLSYMHCG